MTRFPSDHDAPRRCWVRATHHSQAWRAQPRWVRRLAMGVVLLILLGLTAIILVSSLVVGLFVGAVGALTIGAATLIRRIRGQNRAGRRNVRIVVRQGP